ncbi:MAG TPA: hypothetical protein DCY17_00115 [Clostridiales bacterium]|nr:hypothetical protein [Clostridiales bacterium]
MHCWLCFSKSVRCCGCEQDSMLKPVDLTKLTRRVVFGLLSAFLLPKSFGRVVDTEKKLKLLSNAGLAHNDAR